MKWLVIIRRTQAEKFVPGTKDSLAGKRLHSDILHQVLRRHTVSG
jgi:hypothetical protein